MHNGDTYDPALQMHREPPALPVPARLLFQRWLLIKGHGEHNTAGPASGPYRPVVDDYLAVYSALEGKA